MSQISRAKTGERMSQIVVHGGTVYLAGQVPDDFSADIRTQTQQVLDKIDGLLTEAGSSRQAMLSATIYLRDIADFAAMNEIWDAWVVQGHTPARACVEAHLAHADILVEISVIAAA